MQSRLLKRSSKKVSSCFSLRCCQNCFERSPLGSAVLQCASMFEPSRMSILPKEKLHEKSKVLLSCFIDLSVISPRKCDKGTSDFKSFLAEDLSKYATEFQSALAERDRLDNIYFSTIQITKYQELLFVLKLLLILSHGQASVERGFSLKKKILKANMGPETVLAKRLIIDHMVANNLK